MALVVGLPSIGGYVVLSCLQERRVNASSPARPAPPPEVPGPTESTAPDLSTDISTVAAVPEKVAIVGPCDVDVPAPSQDVNAPVPTDSGNAYGPCRVESADRPIGRPPLVPDPGGNSLLTTQPPVTGSLPTIRAGQFTTSCAPTAPPSADSNCSNMP